MRSASMLFEKKPGTHLKAFINYSVKHVRLQFGDRDLISAAHHQHACYSRVDPVANLFAHDFLAHCRDADMSAIDGMTVLKSVATVSSENSLQI
jgi:hypothetical protein